MKTALGAASYLDALRPDPGWEVDMALLTSYSSDLVVMVAAMLALAGLDDERGSGSKVDFASSHEKLAGRLCFLVQAGRMTPPKAMTAVLAIMDRFVRMVGTNEHERSWHPKVSLVRYTHTDTDQVQWRLWIGSRNLTRDCSFDLGLSLVSSNEGNATPLEGISDAGKFLYETSGITRHTPEFVRRELATTNWIDPPGISVRNFVLRHDKAQTGLPTAPDDIDELLVISPFLDGTTVRTLGSWGDAATTRLLLSTRSALAPLLHQAQRPTAGFHRLLFRDAPSLEEEDDGASAEDEAEQLLQGLHAKAICVKTSTGGRMWMGSPNMTMRAWSGSNTEAFVEMDVSPDVYAQIREFVTEGSILDQGAKDEKPEDPREVLLEDARKVISAAWKVTLDFAEGVPILEGRTAFNPGFSGVQVELGLLASGLIECPVGVRTLRLPPVAEYQLTEFVLVRLTLDELVVSWVLQAAFAAGIPADRDQRALAHHLNPRVFLEWIRSMLHPEVVSDGGGDWDAPAHICRSTSGRAAISAPWWAPSLEEVLRAWAHNPDVLQEVNRKLKAYGRYIQEHGAEEADRRDLEVFQEFTKTWEVLRPELAEGGKRG